MVRPYNKEYDDDDDDDDDDGDDNYDDISHKTGFYRRHKTLPPYALHHTSYDCVILFIRCFTWNNTVNKKIIHAEQKNIIQKDISFYWDCLINSPYT